MTLRLAVDVLTQMTHSLAPWNQPVGFSASTSQSRSFGPGYEENDQVACCPKWRDARQLTVMQTA